MSERTCVDCHVALSKEWHEEWSDPPRCFSCLRAALDVALEALYDLVAVIDLHGSTEDWDNEARDVLAVARKVRDGAIATRRAAERDGDPLALIESFVAEYPESPWGPGHITLDDHNLSDGSLDFCLEECSKCEHEEGSYKDRGYPPEEIAALRALLHRLKEIPIAVRARSVLLSRRGVAEPLALEVAQAISDLIEKEWEENKPERMRRPHPRRWTEVDREQQDRRLRFAEAAIVAYRKATGGSRG